MLHPREAGHRAIGRRACPTRGLGTSHSLMRFAPPGSAILGSAQHVVIVQYPIEEEKGSVSTIPS